MSSYLSYLSSFDCQTNEELYEKLRTLATNFLELSEMPFPIEYLGQDYKPEVGEFLIKCQKIYFNINSDKSVQELIRFLKENPPKPNYHNPTFVTSRNEEKVDLGTHILTRGIDLPGSQFNPIGCGYYSDFFMDCYFGNLTEVKAHIKKFTELELINALERREGYCQYSPLFAPILGVTLFTIADRTLFPNDAEEFTAMYTRCNENKHEEILIELLNLGADPNATDIWGHTALHYIVAAFPRLELVRITCYLVGGKAECNFEDHRGWKPLDYATCLPPNHCEAQFGVLYPLLEKNATPKLIESSRQIRNYFEKFGTPDMLEYIKTKLQMCEYCSNKSSLKCAACKLVRYCSKACQKLDWTNHKTICLKNKKRK